MQKPSMVDGEFESNLGGDVFMDECNFASSLRGLKSNVAPSYF